MTKNRKTPIEIDRVELRNIGYQLIDTISDFIDTIDNKPVTTGESTDQIQKILGNNSLPENGSSASELFARATDLLLNHSLFNGHPKFLGYITSSPAPIGSLADFLASAVNPNVGANILSPMATAIEKQTIKWLAEFIGVPGSFDGILVSGGNMANFTAFLAARTAKAPLEFRQEGLAGTQRQMVIYCSTTTHIWIEKAMFLFGHGSNSIHWIPAGKDNKMDLKILVSTIKTDIKNGKNPFLVVGTAGDVSTGVVDDLAAIAAICRTFNLWFHIDGAYGIPAAVLPELNSLFEGIKEADSIALDPHKWLYSPLEAGCTLVKDPQDLVNTFSFHPSYYNFNNSDEEPVLNYYEYGLQNSRGFRALKVWMALQHIGRNGYIKLIREDIEMSKLLYEEARKQPELEAMTQNLSITTLRYVPSGLEKGTKESEAYLNKLNEALLNELQTGGEVFLSNAVVSDKYCLRACIVNFRTSGKDIKDIIEIIVREGKRINRKLQKK